MTNGPAVEDLQERFFEALVGGDEQAAAAVLDEGIARGVDLGRLSVELIGSAQARVGNLWHQGRLNVADEHLATQIALSQLARLRQRAKPRHRLGRRVVLASIEGDQHYLGASIVALFLHMDGWSVDFLGGPVPSRDLLAFVAARQPELVGLSVTLPGAIEGAGDAIAALRRLPSPPRIMIGGAALGGDEAKALALGADGFAAEAEEARRVARRLLGISDPLASLEDYLGDLGSRIQGERKAKGWSQQRMADETGLTRTYIGSVERGERNLSLGALLQIANALDIAPEQLLA